MFLFFREYYVLFCTFLRESQHQRFIKRRAEGGKWVLPGMGNPPRTKMAAATKLALFARKQRRKHGQFICMEVAILACFLCLLLSLSTLLYFSDIQRSFGVFLKDMKKEFEFGSTQKELGGSVQSEGDSEPASSIIQDLI